MKQTIIGVCPSKSNCYRIGHKGLFKTPALTKYEDNFFIQCNQYRNKMIKGYFELHIDVFYPSERADLDNCLKVVLDCLQRVKAIPNDNKCVKIVAQKFKDKKEPRIEFVLLVA
jgi:Holliday junction resolvase RusA-like endonuclease